jgi:hypothetical protein
MKTTLIFLGSLAVVLAIFAYFAVFGPANGTYNVNGGVGTDTPIATSTQLILLTPTSTASSTTLDDGNASSSTDSNDLGEPLGTAFATPPLSWPEGGSKISINALSLEGNQMTFTLTVQTGQSPECVPLNVRLVADEEGDLDPPNPASFTFPDSGNCNGAPNETYANQTTTFTVDPTAFPLLFTTGGASNIFFEVTTSTDNGLNVLFPGTSG